MASLIPRKELPAVLKAIEGAMENFGHPDAVPKECFLESGVSPITADKCLALLDSEKIPLEPATAFAKWCRLIGECSE